MGEHREKGPESTYGFSACMHEIRTENHPLNIWYKCTISAFGQYAPSFLPINPHPAHLVSHGATILHVVQLYSTVAQSDKYCLDCTVSTVQYQLPLLLCFSASRFPQLLCFSASLVLSLENQKNLKHAHFTCVYCTSSYCTRALI